MESSSPKSISVKAKNVIPDDVELPNFDFEEMINEHYKRFPRTAEMIEKPRFVRALKQPFRRFYLLPVALFGLKLNTILSLRWKEYLKLWIYVTILFIPTIFFTIIPLEKAFVTDGGKTVLRWISDILFNVGTPILIAILLSLFYLKYTHDGFLGLIQAKRVEFVEKPVREYYSKYYDRHLPRNPLIILMSLAAGIGIQIPMLQLAFTYGYTVAAVFGVLACIFNPLLFYIFFIAVYFMILNTRIYAKALKPFKDRMNTYLNEYGTLLKRDNYDMIWSLGDKWSKGRSISQLENIPTAGILSTLIIIIAMGMGNANELVYGLNEGMPNNIVDFLFLNKDQPLTIFIVTISALVAALMVLFIFIPLIGFNAKAKKFKIKALMELDNYIFANVVEFGEKYNEEAKQENVTMLQLREFVASMRTFPISTQKIFRTIMAIALWVANIFKIIKSVGVGT
ncbi:MAG: hypothetical protein GOP50_12040 [Candidatus Heimdallarchaeota archaeon]|nr:hypothetical protein [Candidatus Heimdallarchaeota archaeon]